jgi:hypothetical protein
LSSNTLWRSTRDGPEGVPISLRAGRALGGAQLVGDGPPVGVAGVLRRAGAGQVSSRYLVAAPAEAMSAICMELHLKRSVSSHYDPMWITLTPVNMESPLVVFAITEEQVEAIQGWSAATACTLGNGQTIMTVDIAEKDWRRRQNTYELQPLENLSAPPLGRRGKRFQAGAPGRFSAELSAPRRYTCVVNPIHKAWLEKAVAVLVNPLLESDFPGTRARFAVHVVFRDSVEPGSVVLPEAVRVAIGLRAGETVDLYPYAGGRRPRARRGVLQFRHSLCRVIPAATADMHNTVVRLPITVFDVLGLPPGSRVVVESLGGEKGEDGIRRVTRRALEEREGRLPLVIGMPDVLDLVGSVDIPIIAMDRSSREILGITTGAAVYVRPAVMSVVADEFASVSFVILAAIIGALAGDAPELAFGLIGAYVVLTSVLLFRRLR